MRMEEKRKAPELRFPDFTDDWEQRKLAEITDRVTEKNTNQIEKETFTNSAEFGIISQQDFFDHGITNEANIGGYHIVHPDDFVYNPRISVTAPVGPINRNKLGRSGVMSPLYTVFHAHNIDTAFLEYYFKTSKWHQFMYFNGDSGARSDRFSIKTNLFYEMPITMPSDVEQKKIGKFFSTLDKAITLHQRKENLLRELKKGMLQKIFSQEIRFKDDNGQDFPDWEEKQLGEIAEVKDSARIPNNEWTESGVPYIRASDISSGDTSNSLFISKESYEMYLSKTGAPSKGDLLFNGGGEIGAAMMVKTDIPIYVQGGAVLYVRTSQTLDTLIGGYLLCYFESQKAQKYIATNSMGGTMKHYTLRPSKKMPVDLPSISEQKKIADYFAHIDTLIATEQKKVSSLQTMKKGFLQKMFV